MKYYIPIIFAISILASCDKDIIKPPVQCGDNYLVFGHFYGMCLGENCVVTYRLNDTHLYKDTVQDYLGMNLFFEEQPDSQFEIAEGLMTAFPEQLYDEQEEVIGCPDCYDQGGLFIERGVCEDIRTWRVDQDTQNVPEYLHAYIALLNEKISLLQE